MAILITPDKYKGSLDTTALCDALGEVVLAGKGRLDAQTL
jgi:glycerate kinase